MRAIDADALRAQMYHEAFETDSDMQRWDGGCWIRYKMFENAIDNAPTIDRHPERMTNRQWVDFLSAQFDISRTSAKEMLHGMMQWKKEDNFKKMFNGGQK